MHTLMCTSEHIQNCKLVRQKMHKSSWLENCAKLNKGCDKTNNWMNTYKGCAMSPNWSYSRVVYKKKEYSWRGSGWSLWPSFCFNIGNKLYVKERASLLSEYSPITKSGEMALVYNNGHHQDDDGQHDHRGDDVSYHKSLKSDTGWEYQRGDSFHLIMIVRSQLD